MHDPNELVRAAEGTVRRQLGKNYPHFFREALEKLTPEAKHELFRLVRAYEDEVMGADRRALRKLATGRIS